MANVLRLCISQENNLWHYFKFLATNTFMHYKRFVILFNVPLLDAASA